MRSVWLSVPVVVGLVLSGPALARASGVPAYSVSQACALERRPGPNASAASERGCVSDERAARRSLRRLWATFPASDRQNCRQESEIGGPPSYVALLTCLQLADGTLPTEPPPLAR
ncbi:MULTISPECIES: hypothetical protein [Methylobacterium]|uniref:hypothetical protein n=1 Tax=Methylobacterium TaxID=407 RepID=UPI0013EB271B|nr:hypothetical protein [Methylobacterium sp. DB0501]NGM33263.1 hypothetical protein [Methylobacterium sp. DB0501]